MNQTPGLRSATLGLWLLPVYGLLLAVSTVTQQPDVETDFAGYARYITTGEFPAQPPDGPNRRGSSRGLGVMAAAVFLAAGPARRLALTGAVVTVVANVYMAAAFGSASFAQPGIGRAYLRGAPNIQELDADTVSGPALVATIAAALVVLVVGAILVGTAIARTAPGLRWPGIGYAVSLTIFSFSGVIGFGAGTQPVAGLLLVASTVLLARGLPRVGTRAADDGEATDSGVVAPPVVVNVERA